MKLPIKKKYFDMIKKGTKIIEFRDAHITFVCEETGEELRKNVRGVDMVSKHYLKGEPVELDLFKDKFQIWFWLK